MLAQLITSLMYVDLPVAHRRAMKRPQTTIPVCIGHKQTITFGLGWAADTSVPNSPAETVTTVPACSFRGPGAKSFNSYSASTNSD